MRLFYDGPILVTPDMWKEKEPKTKLGKRAHALAKKTKHFWRYNFFCRLARYVFRCVAPLFEAAFWLCWMVVGGIFYAFWLAAKLMIVVAIGMFRYW